MDNMVNFRSYRLPRNRTVFLADDAVDQPRKRNTVVFIKDSLTDDLPFFSATGRSGIAPAATQSGLKVVQV